MFVLYDLGAEGGIPKKWVSKSAYELFSDIEIVAFDLDGKKLSLENSKHSLKFVDKIISDSDGLEEFYIPIRDSGSSLFPFNKTYSYLHEDSYHPLSKKIQVATTSLQKLIDNKEINPADIIKMDIQGAELKALMGLGKHIKKLHVLEIEVEFLELYKNQPTFTDIHKFLIEEGFHLQDMHLSKSFLTNSKVPNYYNKLINRSQLNTSWTPQLYAGDALYVRDLNSVNELDLNEQIRHLKCLCLYKCYDRVFHIIDQSKYKDELTSNQFYSVLLELAKAGRTKSLIFNYFARFLRKIGLTAPITIDKKYPWIDRSFPDL